MKNENKTKHTTGEIETLSEVTEVGETGSGTGKTETVRTKTAGNKTRKKRVK